jgi:hypothetical protein
LCRLFSARQSHRWPPSSTDEQPKSHLNARYCVRCPARRSSPQRRQAPRRRFATSRGTPFSTLATRICSLWP